MSARLIVLALDGVPPEVLFSDRFAAACPRMTSLRQHGVSGSIRSTVPPITVPAWACAMTSRDPGELGIYGFRNRAEVAYGSMRVTTSASVQATAVWDVIGSNGGRSIVIGIPPGYPPRRIAGEWVSCMLTPGSSSEYTWPSALKQEIEGLVGQYAFDVEGFRGVERTELLRRIHAMTEKRWALARHLLRSRDVDLFVLHEIGFDRVHHGFWADHDPDHPKHDPNTPFRTALLDYYAYVDRLIGELLAEAPSADVVIVSDHGCKRMLGGIRVNQWLIDNGYLRLRATPDAPAAFSEENVDWKRTTAWGAGGYYARVWLNAHGREPEGVVKQHDRARTLERLEVGLRSIPDHQGRPLKTTVYRPEAVYREVRGLAPDLLVYFGDLDWRSVASVGGKGWHTFENDTGPDDANHSIDGVLVMSGERIRERRIDLEGARLLDLAPTLLGLLGLSPPAGFGGRDLIAHER